MAAPLIEVRCFSHLGITVTDLDRSVVFYTETLGFRVLFENREDTWTRVGLGLGDVQLELFSRHPGQRGDVDAFYPMTFGRPKIALTVEDVPASFQRLADAGITPLCPVTTTSVSQFFFIADPDGTPIQLHQFSGGQSRVTELFG